MKTLTIIGPLWKYNGNGSWHFVTLKQSTAEKVKRLLGGAPPGWGQVKVRVTVGTTTWETSLFPSKGGEYVLAVKAAVRKKENLEEGTMIHAKLELIV